MNSLKSVKSGHFQTVDFAIIYDWYPFYLTNNFSFSALLSFLSGTNYSFRFSSSKTYTLLVSYNFSTPYPLFHSAYDLSSLAHMILFRFNITYILTSSRTCTMTFTSQHYPSTLSVFKWHTPYCSIAYSRLSSSLTLAYNGILVSSIRSYTLHLLAPPRTDTITPFLGTDHTPCRLLHNVLSIQTWLWLQSLLFCFHTHSCKAST